MQDFREGGLSLSGKIEAGFEEGVVPWLTSGTHAELGGPFLAQGFREAFVDFEVLEDADSATMYAVGAERAPASTHESGVGWYVVGVEPGPESRIRVIRDTTPLADATQKTLCKDGPQRRRQEIAPCPH